MMSENTVENYGWRSGNGPESCNYITPAVLRILHRLGSRRVIDVGAGNGALCAAIAKSDVYVAGVEYDQKGNVIARERYPDIHFYRQGVQDDPKDVLASEMSAFDTVVSTEVIEHLFSPHLLPRYAHGLLSEQGYLVISTPYHGYLKNLALSVLNKWDKHHTALWHGGHIKFWSKATLSQLLHENGFDVTGFIGVGRVPLFWKSMILIARKRSGE
jgi:2-polyprenyl-3-methyl-5-hydroxy-6-metoxy-1,4-benzoquinol methylase